ncbi:glycosyltransferase family 4 protein [Hyunsoonleella aestuarii]|uniref:Glycosyltransferase n=1 Tax=Hyunsoonleella aestuarii TaxID=912802 RepID=A0ABP8E716_9FLAO|nr:glycosyltransferase family 4 protein [Hyunsoonleella aestuarii]
MKKRLLYIGNKLGHKSANISSINYLGQLFENEDYYLFYASSKANKFFRLIDMLWACFKHRHDVDYVLIDTYSTQNFYYALFVSQLCMFLKLKYIPILHGGNLPDRLKNTPKLSKLIFNNAYKNVAPSKYLKIGFEKFGYENITHIPNTIEIKNYQFENRDFEHVNLLWVRSFSNIYNPELAIKIFASLNREGISSTLCMVGPDAEGSLNEVQKLADDLNVDVKFTGKLSKVEWIKLSKDYNIFINTTNFDNMPVSIIEAMALGLPIISTNVGGMPFMIENGVDGILVEPNSEENFVKAIKCVINDPDNALKMTCRAREKVEKFDWSHVKKQWKSILT